MLRETKVRRLLEDAERSARAGQRRRATFFYRRVLSIARPDEWEHELAQARLGALYLAHGEGELAAAHYDRARQLSPQEPAYAVPLATARVVAGRGEDARSPLYDALESPHCRPDALRLLIDLAASDGDRATAAQLARIAARESPTAQWARALAREYADA